MSDDTVRALEAHGDEHDALAVGWALHALDPDEAAAFAAHLETCPHCRRTVDETLETLGGFAEAVEPVDPPPPLRSRLLDAAVAETPEGGSPADGAPSPTAAAPRTTSPDGAVRGSRARHAAVVPLARRRATRWLAAAAVVLVVAAVGGLAVANQSLRNERDAAALRAQRDAAVVDMLRDAGTPGVVHATLADPQGAMVGMVVDDGTGPRVLTTGLGANPTDQIYVLWGLAGGTPRPLGTFDVAEQAPSVRSVPSSTEAAPFAGFAVSLEPGRTAPASPTRVVASGQVGR